VLPIVEPPIRGGWVAVEHDRIIAVGGGAPGDDVREEDLGDVAILPGLVNAHTHLELSYLRGRVPPASSFVTWVRGVVGARRQQPDPQAAEIVQAIADAIAQTLAAGTAVVGDISNTMATYGPLAASALAGIVFYELIRFRAEGADDFVERACGEIDALPPAPRVRAALAAHAPYSIAPPVFRAIARAAHRRPSLPWSVHLSESVEEIEFVRTAAGPWREFLQELGAWEPSFVAPGVSPVQYLDEAGLLGERLIAVHGVQMTRDDLGRLAARGATLVTCPRSNGHTGAGIPPLEEFYRSGVRVAVGTDSLASAPDLNLFAELAAMRSLAPGVPPARLLASATVEGARALGVDAEYGSIEPGKRARLIAVTLSPGAGDVEEWLVGGIQPGQIRWLA
jgi:cytosine/adenosine deaminase-related metal-dependent hydrolase